MQRIIFTIIISVIVNSHVLAGTYSDAVTLQSKCEIAGNLSKSFYGKNKMNYVHQWPTLKSR